MIDPYRIAAPGAPATSRKLAAVHFEACVFCEVRKDCASGFCSGAREGGAHVFPGKKPAR